MPEKYLMFSLDDEKAKKLGEVISNPTCNKIVNLLAENKELSESDIAKELKMPMNTVEYNLNKLIESGIIEKSKNFFWSTKGKKINIYKVANKIIVISPKKSSGVYGKLKSVVPVVLISAVLTYIVYWYYKSALFVQTGMQKTAENLQDKFVSAPAAAETAVRATDSLQVAGSTAWIWFLVGYLVAIIAFMLWNWKKL